MNVNNIRLLLVGIGGYGNIYVDALIGGKNQNGYQISGIIDPKPDGCKNLNTIENMGIHYFGSIGEFYVDDHKADLAVISTPIHMHSKMTVTALEHGSDVLCEKPVCATIQEALMMIEKRNKTVRNVSIGSLSDTNGHIVRQFLI